MKRKTAAHVLHQPIPELVKALAMPVRNRRSGGNVHKKPQTYYTLPSGIKVLQHKR